jgi:hypothetical protein
MEIITTIVPAGCVSFMAACRFLGIELVFILVSVVFALAAALRYTMIRST